MSARFISPGLAAFLLLSWPAIAQQTDSVLSVLASRHPAEKVFVHYDKESYVAGETAWFKAYFTSEGKPSGLSTSFYLRLSDERGALVAEKKYPILGATAKGSIDLPDSLPQGNYYITAATPYMLQQGSDMIHRENIYVFNPVIKGKTPAGSYSNMLSVGFFPESGHLVHGLLTTVAFRATDGGGNPVDISGVIRTEEGTTICSFKTYHDGIGKTQFKPLAGKKYKAEVEYPAGKINTYTLPDVLPEGINLKVQDEPGGKLFLLARHGKDNSAYRNLTIMAEMNNRVVYETDIDLEDYPSVKGHLITDSLPSGILHFTVFHEGLPLAERLTFVNNKEYLAEARLEAGKFDPAAKAENSFELVFPDELQRSLSVAVTDASVYQPGDEENIWSSFLLSGDLRGHIVNPAWYFNQSNDSVLPALDNLMLTHGWSRYEWKKLLAGEFPAPPQQNPHFLYLGAVVHDAFDKGPVEEGKLNIYLESEDSSSQNFEIPVGKDGRFMMDSVIYLGRARFFYVYTNSRGKELPVKIHVERVAYDSAVFASFIGKENKRLLNPEKKAFYAERQFDWLKNDKGKIKELERVVLQSKTSKKPVEIVNEKYTTGVFRAPGKVNIDNINQPAADRSGNVMDFIKNRIQQVELQGNRFVSRKNFSLMTGQKWNVDVFLDEAPVNAAILRTLRMDEIALVKYYETGFVGAGTGSPGGLIAVYTKKKDKEDQPVDKLEFFTSQGYSVTKQFYNPDYSNPALRQLPDNRSTVYWNPDVYTDSDTKSVKLNFFNNDTGRKYRIVVEGFDVNGKLVHLEKWME